MSQCKIFRCIRPYKLVDDGQIVNITIVAGNDEELSYLLKAALCDNGERTEKFSMRDWNIVPLNIDRPFILSMELKEVAD